MRTFSDEKATRERVPLLLGLFGPSGSGKTFSALRLATGMQRVTGGDIYVIDTEARRALHYADTFSFRHVDFRAPFSSLDYLAAIEHCAKAGAGVVVVDSMSHEHEGVGGLLEWHEAELERLAGNDWQKRERVKMLAWAQPKAARRKLVQAILQLGINAVFCFRAKEKLKLESGKQPVDLGWQPICGEEFMYEMTAAALLPPGGRGVPLWNPTLPGEKAMVKLPLQFEPIFDKLGKQPLSEDVGQELAEWSSGTQQDGDALLRLVEEINAAATVDALKAIAASAARLGWSGAQRGTIREAIKLRHATLSPPSQGAGPESPV